MSNVTLIYNSVEPEPEEDKVAKNEIAVPIRHSYQHSLFKVMLAADTYKIIDQGPLNGYLQLYREGEAEPVAVFPKDVWVWVEKTG